MCDCKYFDKDNCEICRADALEFDEMIHCEKTFAKEKDINSAKDTRMEKLLQWRSCDKWRYAKEPKWARKMWQNGFKAKMKQNILKEEYYRPSIKEYRTYGWLTW